MAGYAKRDPKRYPCASGLESFLKGHVNLLTILVCEKCRLGNGPSSVCESKILEIIID